MDANQETRQNPFGMDEDCQNCPALCDTRSQVLHGYGDVGADFVVIGETPTAGADERGVPFTGEDDLVLEILDALGLAEYDGDGEPDLSNAYLTYLARCHHPDRAPTDEELRNCEGYLTGDVRMINPEIIVTVGQRPLSQLAFEYTTMSEDELSVDERHATTIRGRGFELLPMYHPDAQSASDTDAFLEHFADELGRDYRQTKGRQGNIESGRGPDTGDEADDRDASE